MQPISTEQPCPLADATERPLPLTTRAAWRQRVRRLIKRFLTPYADLPPDLFSTEEYRLLSGSVRWPEKQNPWSF